MTEGIRTLKGLLLEMKLSEKSEERILAEEEIVKMFESTCEPGLPAKVYDRYWALIKAARKFTPLIKAVDESMPDDVIIRVESTAGEIRELVKVLDGVEH